MKQHLPLQHLSNQAFIGLDYFRHQTFFSNLNFLIDKTPKVEINLLEA